MEQNYASFDPSNRMVKFSAVQIDSQLFYSITIIRHQGFLLVRVDAEIFHLHFVVRNACYTHLTKCIKYVM